MAIYGGPDIITDNLELCLDASNSKSYSGSGSSWNDLVLFMDQGVFNSSGSSIFYEKNFNIYIRQGY